MSEDDWCNNYLGYTPITIRDTTQHTHLFMRDGQDIYHIITSFLLVRKVIRRWVRSWINRRRRIKEWCKGRSLLKALQDREIGIN